jgi:GTP1/Obg family GTP-binding protein
VSIDISLCVFFVDAITECGYVCIAQLLLLSSTGQSLLLVVVNTVQYAYVQF